MKKTRPFKIRTPEEEYKYTHSKRNINGHIRINEREAEKALYHARHIDHIGDLSKRGAAIKMRLEEIKKGCKTPLLQSFDYQCLEWELSQLVMEAGEILQAAGKIQEYLHGTRLNNQMLCNLIRGI
jgi:hypothetical protein